MNSNSMPDHQIKRHLATDQDDLGLGASQMHPGTGWKNSNFQIQ